MTTLTIMRQLPVNKSLLYYASYIHRCVCACAREAAYHVRSQAAIALHVIAFLWTSGVGFFCREIERSLVRYKKRAAMRLNGGYL